MLLLQKLKYCRELEYKRNKFKKLKFKMILIIISLISIAFILPFLKYASILLMLLFLSYLNHSFFKTEQRIVSECFSDEVVLKDSEEVKREIMRRYKIKEMVKVLKKFELTKEEREILTDILKRKLKANNYKNTDEYFLNDCKELKIVLK